MKVVLAGGTGQVGTLLARHLHSVGHEVVVLSRTGRPSSPWRTVCWDGQSLGPWVRDLEGARALINLAGRSVNCRYTWKNRWKILESRVRSVRVLGRAVEALECPPVVWLQAATATIYADSYDADNDEVHGVLGGFEPGVPDSWRFSVDVARAWEGEFALVSCPATRKVILRSAMTMSADRGGVFHYLLTLVRLGLGGRAASGAQFVSWIHGTDFIRAVEFLIEREDLAGVINVSSPAPLPYARFMDTLRRAWGMPLGLPAFRWMIEIGTFLMRTESELVLKSRRVIPGRLERAGFTFRFPGWDQAAADLCREWRDHGLSNRPGF